jgi:hypothetical protein
VLYFFIVYLKIIKIVQLGWDGIFCTFFVAHSSVRPF